MLACILFVFGALVEYACLLFDRGLYGDQIGEEDMVDVEQQQQQQQQQQQLDNNSLAEQTSPNSTNGQHSFHLVEMRSLLAMQEQQANNNGTQQQQQQQQQQFNTDKLISPPLTRRRRYNLSRLRRYYARVDRFFLVLFPLAFVAFNLVYWTAYTLGQRSEGIVEAVWGAITAAAADATSNGSHSQEQDRQVTMEDSKSNWI